MNTQTPTTKQLSDAFRFGLEDALQNAPFAPESLYVRRIDRIQYALGFEALRGANEVTRQFTKSVNWQ